MENTDITLNSDILIIDDSAVILAFVKKILKNKYTVRTAQSAKLAYSLLEEEIPDLILLDLEMPEINGFAFLETIMDNPKWKDIPVIFLTGTDDRKKEEQALEMGAAEYLLKPISEGILLKRVHFHLELRLFQRKLEEMVESRTEELLKTQEELRIAAETANEALRVKTTFLANMSHEIRTPMNSIMGFSELALDSDISQETRGYFLKIKDSIILLLRIINDILDISKIEAGKMEMESISFCPSNVLSNCQTMILQQVNEKGLKFKLNIDEELSRKQLLGDPVRLYQAILNLLSNAAKFTKSGTISLTAKLVSSDNDEAVVRFVVKDSGIGMSKEQLEQVFDPFVQVDSETTRAHDGTGLGLPITRSIVELMGGTLKADSKPGVGSKFSFEVKFPETEAISLFDDIFGVAGTEQMEKPMFRGEVLVCEDNRMNQQVIREHLSRVGLDTVIAENGLEGLKIVMERIQKGGNLFDIILMDMQMPVMDGFEATAKINAFGTGMPIVALTANVMATDIENYKRNGLLDYIGKPFQTWDLWRCLLSFLNPVSKSAVDLHALNQSDIELRMKLQLNFPKENHDRMLKVRSAIDTGDIKLARLLAHTLKSNAGLIGESRLQELAAMVESMLERENVHGIGPHVNHLESELRMVLDKLELYNAQLKSRKQYVDREIEMPEVKAPEKAEKKSIFIVDDEKSNIIALTHILRDEYSVFVTRDSRDAMKMAEEHNPDVIILDILMPEMDGYEVMSALKKSKKARKIPVVFISGLGSPEAIEKGLSMGAADYIPKPFESSTVRSKVRKLLD